MTKLASVPINKIRINNNRRPIKQEKVDELMESIRANGLLNPITLDDNWNLVAGHHRLKACEQLGLKEIECHIIVYQDSDRARLAEIDENLIRNELRPLERGRLWLEREEILLRLGLLAKVGDNQYTLTGRNITGSEIISPPIKTAKDLAKESGLSERTYQYDKQIIRNIHPDILQIIENTPIAQRQTALLNIARAGSKERIQAEQAEKALALAKASSNREKQRRQAEIVLNYRTRQKQAQLSVLKSTEALIEAKSSRSRTQNQQKKLYGRLSKLEVNLGDRWKLGENLVYCGDTSSDNFQDLLPKEAALTIATLSSTWKHDYLVEESRIVAVLRKEGYIYDFCRSNKMPFQYELAIGNIYIGIFSRQNISKPPMPVNVENVEGIVNYLLHLYSSPNDCAIAPFMGEGEILAICQRLKRICFIGDDNPQRVSRGIIRWQNMTDKQAQKI
ncbi:ParB N-terminal domain-containing protein [Mastigocoleus sp. MO_188.B34]|uniref:ParB/RepB/Spo0J family partition protein n=1 Tax=Mastigocoleus sp. MO_188.B34 TaxID=3036635 RepID=UPI002619F1D5|nr:ParB N-terminal domain-containing protein [Mastigocoleus sp. MO_188.B34]MDJ0692860.1 ParB N-terminal domain-containing protein [Mastigocoleus sp. MO_188.B34]